MKYLSLFICLLGIHLAFSQTKLPIIRATASAVAIKDGDYLDKNAWTLAPETKPDVFIADRSRKAKWVTFYTDIDSIKVRVKPGTKFDFIVLLNDKDSCYTQIQSAIAKKKPLPVDKDKHDTIPFTLTAYNAIQVKALLNNQDSLDLHLDISTLGFRFTKEAILKKTHLLENQADVLAGKANANYNALAKVSKLQIGTIIWENPTISAANAAAHNMDGRLGWKAFDGKIVEIDYDKSLIIIHSKLPKYKKDFVKSEITFIQSLICIESSIAIEKKEYTGNFLFDNGSDQAMMIDSALVKGLSTPLSVIKKLTFSDGAGKKYETAIVAVPLVKTNGFALSNVPSSLLGANSPVGAGINVFGNDYLKRFNVLIDLQTDHIYMKPNKLIGLPYR